MRTQHLEAAAAVIMDAGWAGACWEKKPDAQATVCLEYNLTSAYINGIL